MKSKFQLLLAVVLTAAFTLTACGGSDTSTEGPIVIAGSSTVFPLASRMAERFEDEVLNRGQTVSRQALFKVGVGLLVGLGQ